MNVIKQALVSMESEEQDRLNTEQSPDPQAQGKSLKMDGPLSAIYTKALEIQFAKPDPLTGAPAQESLAIYNYNNAKVLQATKPEHVKTEEDTTVNVYTTGTALKTDGKPEEVIPVITELQGINVPNDFIFVATNTSPTDDTPIGGDSMTAIEPGQVVRLAAEDIESYSVVIRLKRK